MAYKNRYYHYLEVKAIDFSRSVGSNHTLAGQLRTPVCETRTYLGVAMFHRWILNDRLKALSPDLVSGLSTKAC